jgi:hypothetical protein
MSDEAVETGRRVLLVANEHRDASLFEPREIYEWFDSKVSISGLGGVFAVGVLMRLVGFLLLFLAIAGRWVRVGMLALAWLAVVFFQWIDVTINQCIVCFLETNLSSFVGAVLESWSRDVKFLFLTFVCIRIRVE